MIIDYNESKSVRLENLKPFDNFTFVTGRYIVQKAIMKIFEEVSAQYSY